MLPSVSDISVSACALVPQGALSTPAPDAGIGHPHSSAVPDRMSQYAGIYIVFFRQIWSKYTMDGCSACTNICLRDLDVGR